MAGERWNPWRVLRARARTLLEWQGIADDDGFCEVRPDGVEVVVLDPELGRRDRRAVLGHELVHLERGLLPAGTPRAVVEREEHQVRQETARRLVPLAELAEFVRRFDGAGVTPNDVADEFDVPSPVAERALAQLRHPGAKMMMLISDEAEGREGAA